MSVTIDTKNYTREERLKILKDLTIPEIESDYGKTNSWYLFTSNEIKKDEIKVPFYYYNSNLKKNNLGNSQIKFSRTNLTFTGQLREVQLEIKNDVFTYLNTYRSLLISLYTGCGKTAYAIYLATQLKYKSLICVHRINIIEQWIEAIHKFVPDAKVQLLDSNNELDPTSDFYIINTDTISKRNDLTDIGIFIVDEAHCALTEKRAMSLLRISPRYLIGLTATPDKSNGMDFILDLFFGPRIIRKMWRPFNVYLVNSNYKPVSATNNAGRLDWNKMISDMCTNEERNELIARIASYFKTRNFIILCKRKDQVEILYEKLKERNEDVEKYTGTQKKFNNDCRILCSTYSKSGIGFNMEKLDALIVASDVDEGIEQYQGRIFRVEDTHPIIFDFREAVYKNHPFNKHLNNRCEMYKASGGICKRFENYFILPEE